MKWWIRGSIAAGLAALAWWKLRKKPQPALELELLLLSICAVMADLALTKKSVPSE